VWATTGQTLRFRILDLLLGCPRCPSAAQSSEAAPRYGPLRPRSILFAMSTRSSGEPIEAVRHQLRPLFDQVVIKELDQDRMRRSGLVVPSGTDDPPPQQGIVLAIGPGLDWWESAGVDMPVQPGDHVVFPSSAGVWVEIDEERLLVCRVGEILGVLESLESDANAS
jgi:chaperonin GroES